MSGKPSVEGVKMYRAVIARMASASEAIRAESEIISDAQARLALAEQEYRNADKEEVALRKRMDLASPGNYGHEGRWQWFVTELARQSASPSAGEPKQ